jgi:transcription termination/antitermination protein NusA
VDIRSETEFAEEEAEMGYQEEEVSGRCAAILANGKRCPNASLPGSRYCGLPAHQALEGTGTDYLVPPEDEGAEEPSGDGAEEAAGDGLESAAAADAADQGAPDAAGEAALEAPSSENGDLPVEDLVEPAPVEDTPVEDVPVEDAPVAEAPVAAADQPIDEEPEAETATPDESAADEPDEEAEKR